MANSHRAQHNCDMWDRIVITLHAEKKRSPTDVVGFALLLPVCKVCSGGHSGALLHPLERHRGADGASGVVALDGQDRPGDELVRGLDVLGTLALAGARRHPRESDLRILLRESLREPQAFCVLAVVERSVLDAGHRFEFKAAFEHILHLEGCQRREGRLVFLGLKNFHCRWCFELDIEHFALSERRCDEPQLNSAKGSRSTQGEGPETGEAQGRLGRESYAYINFLKFFWEKSTTDNFKKFQNFLKFLQM